MSNLTNEIKDIIVETVDREDITADGIADDMILFGEGLGLDSIDALELAVALQMKYGFKVDPKKDNLDEHFRTVSTLADFISSNRGGK